MAKISAVLIVLLATTLGDCGHAFSFPPLDNLYKILTATGPPDTSLSNDVAARALIDYKLERNEEKLRAMADLMQKKNAEIEALRAEIQQLGPEVKQDTTFQLGISTSDVGLESNHDPTDKLIATPTKSAEPTAEALEVARKARLAAANEEKKAAANEKKKAQEKEQFAPKQVLAVSNEAHATTATPLATVPENTSAKATVKMTPILKELVAATPPPNASVGKTSVQTGSSLKDLLAPKKLDAKKSSTVKENSTSSSPEMQRSQVHEETTSASFFFAKEVADEKIVAAAETERSKAEMTKVGSTFKKVDRVPVPQKNISSLTRAGQQRSYATFKTAADIGRSRGSSLAGSESRY